MARDRRSCLSCPSLYPRAAGRLSALPSKFHDAPEVLKFQVEKLKGTYLSCHQAPRHQRLDVRDFLLLSLQLLLDLALRGKRALEAIDFRSEEHTSELQS